MKEIKLSNSDQFALINDSHFDLISQYSWSLDRGGYPRTRILFGDTRKKVRMHRLILDMINSKNQVDHINRNKIDNRSENLRICTSSQNAWNKTPRGVSKYLGVSIKNDTQIRNGITYKYKRICASIRMDGKTKHLGYFKTEEDAAKAYDKAAIFCHKEFANLNFK